MIYFSKKKQIPYDIQCVPDGVSFIQSSLEECGSERKSIIRMLLLTEELLVKLIGSQTKESEGSVWIQVTSIFGETRIRIWGKGEKLEIPESMTSLADADDPEAEEVIRNIVLKAYQDNMDMKYRNGINTVSIRVTASRYRQLLLTLGAMVLGIFTGIILKMFVPQTFTVILSDDLFSPVSTMFLNAVKFVVAPLVFFSIASCIGDYGDMKALGRIGGKVIGTYFFTSLLAVFLGAGIYGIFRIGDPALAGAVTDAASSAIEKSTAVSTSAKDMIMGIIPSDIITPFLNMDMLQVIFIAFLLGFTTKKIGQYSETFRTALNTGNAVFSQATAIIISFMPLSVFCSMAKMIISLDIKNLLKLLTWPATIYFADILMICVYGLLLLIVGRLNPVTFFRKFSPAMLSAFTMASSSATIPVSIEICKDRLGIAKKVYSFSIPLGATINMDGSCITQMISALFMAKIFGVPMTMSLVFSMALTIFVLSVGAPGVPGGALVCIALLLPQYGIPVEGISLIMGLYSLVGMMQTCVNVTGDATVTTIVAKSEGLMDMEKFKNV
ncbi:MAG: dicarboxylate/amino acid:cation symporter [Frisingicoccus sp.]|nr:dicarboxylate/amino acid:cation symporter [Frisingicoccus sp.]